MVEEFERKLLNSSKKLSEEISASLLPSDNVDWTPLSQTRALNWIISTLNYCDGIVHWAIGTQLPQLFVHIHNTTLHTNCLLRTKKANQKKFCWEFDFENSVAKYMGEREWMSKSENVVKRALTHTHTHTHDRYTALFRLLCVPHIQFANIRLTISSGSTAQIKQ